MLKDIDPFLEELKTNFDTRITFSATWRKHELSQLMKGVKEMFKDLQEAMFLDLGRN